MNGLVCFSFGSWGTITTIKISNIRGDSWKKIKSCYETNSCYKQISTKNSWLLFGLVLIFVSTVSWNPIPLGVSGPKAAERLRELSQDLQRQVLDKGDLRYPVRASAPEFGLCQLRGDPQLDSPTPWRILTVLLYMVCHGSHQYTPNVSIYTSTMDPMGTGYSITLCELEICRL